MPEWKYRSISLWKEMVERIEDLIKENARANLKKTVKIVITPNGATCAECKASSCRHLKFASANPKTQELIR